MPPQLTPDVAALIAVSIIWLAVEFRQSRRKRPAAAKAPDSCSRVFTFAPVVGIAIGVVLSWITPDATIRPPWLIALIGLAALLCGGALRLWCFRTLGDYFTFEVMTSSEQPVITSGPYRLVRHPSYAGLTLALVGEATLMSNWLSLGLVAASAWSPSLPRSGSKRGCCTANWVMPTVLMLRPPSTGWSRLSGDHIGGQPPRVSPGEQLGIDYR